VIWILLVVLTVLGGLAAVGVATNERRKSLAGGGGTQKQLGAGGGDKLLERTVRDLRVDDVLTIDGKDFICEGAILYDEDGHRWVAGRCVDGTDVRWVVVGIDRTGTSASRLLVQDESTPITGYPPEAIVVGETRYALDKRGTATGKLSGDLGSLTMGKEKGVAAVERCRWWLYNAAGDDTLVLEQWGGEYRLLRGKKVGADTIDLIPGS
jgi:hypothetical protein